MTMIKQTALCVAFCILISACAGGNAIEQGVPNAALNAGSTSPFPSPAEPGSQLAESATSAPQPSAPPVSALASGSASNTGTFPNSAIERKGETDQITNAERDQMIAELEALKGQQQGNTVSVATYKKRLLELQRLAKTHSRDTIKTIEAQ